MQPDGSWAGDGHGRVSHALYRVDLSAVSYRPTEKLTDLPDQQQGMDQGDAQRALAMGARI